MKFVPATRSFLVEYSTFRDGKYSPYIRAFVYRKMPLPEFVAFIRRNLLGSPTWVRKHVPIEFEQWAARFWFRYWSIRGYVYFSVDIFSHDINRISSREAALKH